MDIINIAGKFSEFLLLATKKISSWLQSELPSFDERWWESLVLSALTYQQKQRVERSNITSIGQLDLAALLRIFDRNWYQLSQKYNFSQQDRNYFKEMQTVRNRWAHIDTLSLSSEDVYRDLDTLQRVVLKIYPNDTLGTEIKAFKEKVIVEISQKSKTPIQKEVIEQTDIDKKNMGLTISVGDEVSLISSPSKRGAVMQIDGDDPTSRCKVWMDNKQQSFYLSQLMPVVHEEKRRLVSLSQLHSLLTCLQIMHPSLSNLYSLNAARIDFVPYQFRPALKIIQSDRPRLLIADGVGVGKTIEAGLILRELQARNDIKSVLIICPKPLVAERKWVVEMKRFDEQFTQLDGAALKHCIEEMDLEGYWPDIHRKTIIPFSLFDENLLLGNQKGRKQQLGLLSLDPPPHFDLVIVDEAHHIRNQTTFTHQGVRFFCDNAEAVVFLTATPIQMGNHDLFSLLNVLRPDLIIDNDTFEHMAEPNPFINRALSQARAGQDDWQLNAANALQGASNTSWGNSLLKKNPEFVNLCNTLEQAVMDRESRIKAIRQIEQFHSFARIINRTRRRDIDSFCIRRTETIEIPFTEAQMELHDELLQFESIALSMIHKGNNVGFMMSMIRRQAASCIFGLAPFISDILNRRLSILEVFEIDDSNVSISEEFDSLNEMARNIEKKSERLSPDDPKLKALLKIISDKQKLANNKLMIFSSFRHTLSYLETKLIDINIRVGLIHGDVKDEDRLFLRNRFEKKKEDPNAIDVMLFSEVGCEGLDYQFCDGMINYDLPWNPMRIEQRIGRIDRRGQKSEYVTIYNFTTPETVDADIYVRCLMRIGIFEESIGDCEEILGEIHSKIKNIAEDTELTKAEKREKFEQLAGNKINKIQEQRRLEDKEHDLFGLQIPKDKVDDEIQNSESYWLTSAALKRFVNQYLDRRIGPGEYILGEKLKKTLRLSQDARNSLLVDFRKLEKSKTPMFRSWEKWLKGDEQHCNITFDSECAVDNRNTFFIMPLHPFVLQAAIALESPEPVHTTFKVINPDSSPGDYKFAIYAWEYKGIRPEIKLVPICEHDEIREEFFDHLECGVAINVDRMPTEEEFKLLDKKHHELWGAATTSHKNSTKELCSFRKESLRNSYQGRISVVEDQIRSATNEKIRRMRDGQKNRIQADFDREIEALKGAEKKADIYTRPVVFGVLKIIQG